MASRAMEMRSPAVRSMSSSRPAGSSVICAAWSSSSSVVSPIAETTTTTSLPAYNEGNLVEPLIHGTAYFDRLVECVERLDAGDHLFFTDWRGDPDEQLRPGGAPLAPLFTQAGRRANQPRPGHPNLGGIGRAARPPPGARSAAATAASPAAVRSARGAEPAH